MSIYDKLDHEMVRIVALAKQSCGAAGITRLVPEWYAVTILASSPNPATDAVKALGGDLEKLLAQCRTVAEARTKPFTGVPDCYSQVVQDKSCRAMGQAAEAFKVKSVRPRIGIAHTMLAIIETCPEIAQAFADAGITLESLQAKTSPPQRRKPTRQPAPVQEGVPCQPEPCQSRSHRDALQDFCTDLTALAAAGKLDPVIGRETELDRVMVVLCRRTKNNALLLGPPGTGKTAIVEGLAQRIVSGNVRRKLRNKRILALNLNSVIAGTQFRGQFEERMEAIMDAVRARSNVIIFIDEMHTVVGAGAALGTLDAGNILKPALARGELRCIGATTFAEYKKYFKKDKALERRFACIPVNEPTPEQTTQILQGLRPVLENHHGCRFSDEALSAAVELSNRHVGNRCFPDKAIDVLDEVGAQFGGDGAVLDRDKVAKVVADQAGVPLTAVIPNDAERASQLETELQRLVVGQDAAIATVVHAARRAFSPLRDSARPLASLVFAGPSSVGKSHVARIIGANLCPNAPLIRINMAEFAERHSVSRLFGAPPGYVGHGDQTQLTDRIARHPHSVVLFDNLDKAHQQVVQAIMEILDIGLVTDAEGNEVNFRSAFIIMTTTAGAKESAKTALGFGVGYDGQAAVERLRQNLVEGCKQLFGDEFVNRVDDFVPFRPLNSAALRQVANLAIAEITARLAAVGVTLDVAPEVVNHVCAGCTNAREVRNAVRNKLEPLICSVSLTNKCKLHVRLQSGQLIIG